MCVSVKIAKKHGKERDSEHTRKCGAIVNADDDVVWHRVSGLPLEKCLRIRFASQHYYERVGGCRMYNVPENKCYVAGYLLHSSGMPKVQNRERSKYRISRGLLSRVS
jgi:hypothetical protein